MIEVETPRGVIEFPPGTPPQVMEYVTKRFVAGKPVSQAEVEAYQRGVSAGPIDALGRSLARGATLGFSDEIVAGMRSAFTGVPYRAALAEERAADEGVRARRPVLSMGGEVAGAVVSPITRVLPFVASSAPGTSALSHGARVLGTGALAGGIAGGIAGAGEAESNADVPEEVARGALFGAGAGGVLSGALMIGSFGAGRIAHALGLRNPEAAAERQILRALERDKVDIASLAAKPPPADQALVDVAGQATRHLGATAANVPSQAMSAADHFVASRRLARPDRVAQAVDNVLGGGNGEQMMARLDALATARARAAAPLYEQVREVRVPGTVLERLSPIIESKLGQDAMRRGLAILEAEGKAAYLESVRAGAPNPRLLFDPARVGVTMRDGKIELQGRMPTLGLLDAIKRGLDDIVEQYRDPVTMRLNLTQESRAINDIRQQFAGILKDKFPVYRRALEAWSGPTKLIEAMAFGREALRLDPDQIAKRVGRMTPDERQAMMIGLGRAITDMTADPARAPTAVRRLVEDRTMQRRLEYLVPEQGRRQQLMDVLARELNMSATERAVSPRAGSQTARILAGMEDMTTDPPGGALQALIEGKPARALGQALGTGSRRLFQGITPATADAMAMRLFATDPAKNAEIVEQLMRRAAADRAAAERVGPMLRGLVAGSGAAAAQQTR